ncbi:MAG: FkbM family methyltransferase [Solirubrobacteraceae bacterium]
MPAPAELTRRALKASPALRAIADTRVAQQVIQTQRAARVLAPARRFTVNQARRGTVGVYRLRRNGHPVHVRHRTRDIDILAEIFTAGTYQPPAGVDLDGPLRIMDLGGNVGLFGLYALQRWNVAGLRSYEPDPANAQLLKATARHHDQWDVIESAVSNATGQMRFAVGRYSESRAATDDEEAITVPVIDVFDEPAADLWKIDIEGGEWPILTDPRLPELQARAVVVEWHARESPEPDAHGHASRLLADAGFVHQHDEGGRFGSNGLLWTWR